MIRALFILFVLFILLLILVGCGALSKRLSLHMGKDIVAVMPEKMVCGKLLSEDADGIIVLTVYGRTYIPYSSVRSLMLDGITCDREILRAPLSEPL